jgi:predicted alpha/beta-fold hydrolase
MTIFPSLIRPKPALSTRRERFELPDGDFLDLDWVEGRAVSGAPLVLVLHGLEGSIDSAYTRGILLEVESRGWRGVLMHFRGCSGEVNRLARSYHSGETSDVRTLVAELRERFPDARLFAVGYSLGGNVLLKYLGEESEKSVLTRAAAVSVPMTLSVCADRLNHGFSRVYEQWLLSSLKATFRKKAECVDLGLAVERDQVKRLASLRAFDDRVTAPIHGFASAQDYYERSSSRPFLARITTPTWIIHAKDDPFMTEAVIPEPHELSSAVTLELSNQGGHVGFVAGDDPLRPVYWLEHRIPEILAGAMAP